ncbi:hypothetical protein CA600_12310 [Paenibacillus sp. VTT E-133280]|uniref:accessory gene regulator B family protein n=1 Tax=Paenibacillus sp. VTT E-133280 TaxID=1986222 RepID=UPI000BA188E9|nr:hypothetical protein CA600_12310 [Paenibacillus sp. VTT E-133280]
MILEKLSRHIAIKIKSDDPQGPGSVEVLEYGIGIQLNLYFGIISTVIFGYIFSNVLSSMIALLSFMALRKFSGGVHLPITLCSLVTGLAAALIPLAEISQPVQYSIGLISLVIMWMYAPNDYEDINAVGFNEHWSKLTSIAIVIVGLCFSNSIVTISFFVQAILILPIYPRKGGV